MGKSDSSSSCSSDDEWRHCNLPKHEKKMRKKWKKQMRKGKIPYGTPPPWQAAGYAVPPEGEHQQVYEQQAWYAEAKVEKKEKHKKEGCEHKGDGSHKHREEKKEGKKDKSGEHKDHKNARKDEKHSSSGHVSQPSKDLPGSAATIDYEKAAASVGKVSLDSTAELYRPTVRPASNFSAEADATVLRNSMKGAGTEEAAIIGVISKRSNQQRQDISKFFKTMFGKDLETDLQSELSGNLKETIMALFKPPAFYDAWSLHDAIAGLGTKDSTLIEILCTRSNSQIKDIVKTYKETYGRDLEKDIMGDTSGHYERLLVSCLQGNRAELTNEQLFKIAKEGPESVINRQLAKEEAQKLFEAGEKKWGTDESAFLQVLALRHFYQLQATFDEYQKIANKDILQSISSEMSGKLETGFKAIVQVARNRPKYFAEKLKNAIGGLGTDDSTLIRIVVSRSEVDLQDIKDDYKAAYGQTLAQAIASDTSGDYRNLLISIVGQ